jgi:hypothetical protein
MIVLQRYKIDVRAIGYQANPQLVSQEQSPL